MKDWKEENAALTAKVDGLEKIKANFEDCYAALSDELFATQSRLEACEEALAEKQSAARDMARKVLVLIEKLGMHNEAAALREAISSSGAGKDEEK